jgi:uncharacterized membrane protein
LGESILWPASAYLTYLLFTISEIMCAVVEIFSFVQRPLRDKISIHLMKEIFSPYSL